MVNFPFSLQPTHWLHFSAASLDPDHGARLQAVEVACQKGNWEEVQTIASSIRQQRWIKQGDWLSTAVMLVNIADQCLLYDEFEIALIQYGRAQYILHLHINLIQRQNEAAALYGMGIAELALRHSAAASAYFNEAREMLAMAERYWIINSQNENAARCNQRKRWLEEITRVISAAMESLSDHEIIWSQILPRKWIFMPAVGGRDDTQLSTQIRHMLQAQAVAQLKQVRRTHLTDAPDAKSPRLLLRHGGRS